MPTDQSELNFYEITQHYLSNTSMLNLFNILYDSDERIYFMNIFRNYIINEDIERSVVHYDAHEIDDSEFPDTIAYKYYNSQYLWWVIGLFNNIINPFEEFDTENKEFVKILKTNYLYQLLQEIQLIGNR